MDEIIVVNEKLKQAVSRNRDLRSRVTTIPAYIAPTSEEFGDPNSEIVTLVAECVSVEEYIVLVSGFFLPHYGFHHAVNAFRHLGSCNACLVCVTYGPVSDSYANSVRAKAELLNQRVIWLRDLPPTDFLYLLSNVDVLVRPCDLDGDSITIREARSLGIPVIASDGVPRPAGTILFNLDDTESLVSALGPLLSRSKQSKKGGAQASPDFASEIVQIYNPPR